MNTNKYLQNLNKIEFVVTYACTGRCKHCSEGEHTNCGEHIDPDIAADAVRKIASEYHIETVMTFGGEPLLYPDTVFKIHSSASEMGIPKRQIITNGYFSKDFANIYKTAELIAKCGVNDVLLSVDAFHQETIPLETVKLFATAVIQNGVPIRLQPAWLVSDKDNNPYNQKTKRILDSFSDLGIEINDGNIVFCEGNAKKYLSEYFVTDLPQNPYIEDVYNVKCVSFSPNGDVLCGNIYRENILDILNNYMKTRSQFL